MRIKGLLLKDGYTLLRQMRVFVLMIVFFAIMPGTNMMSFAIVYAGMFTLSAMSYDERSSWDYFAAMMPYSTKELVLSKYMLAYIGVAGASLLSILSQGVLSMFHRQENWGEVIITLLVMICLTLLMQAINLPVMYKLGVEKGRLAFFVTVFVLVGGVVLVGNKLFGENAEKITGLLEARGIALLIGMVVVTVIANIVSIGLSIKFYPYNIGRK